jgi:hypothetical protein
VFVSIIKKVFLPVISILGGCALALLAAGVNSLFFVLLPVIAFALGFFSTWRWGLLCGFILFACYTFTISIIWYGFNNPNLLYPVPYIGSFVFGGFSIPLIGALAAGVWKGRNKKGSKTALVVSVLITGLCIYLALPRYGHYYQVTIQSQEDLKNLEVYLPVAAASGEPYDGLYSHVYDAPWGVTGNFKQEIVTTENGRMLKLIIPDMKATGMPSPKYVANIIFMENFAPYKLTQLTPKTNVQTVNVVTSRQMRGPVTRSENVIKERFSVPVKIISNAPAQVNLSLENRTDRGNWINFAYGKSYPYDERGRFDMQTGDWVFLPVEASVLMEIKGISD